MKVKLSERKVEQVVQELNDVLDKHYIYGSEYNKQVILELIMQNLKKDQTEDLIKRIEETPKDKWKI